MLVQGTVVTPQERPGEETVALLEMLQRSAPVGIVFVGTGLRVKRLNDRMAAILGAGPDPAAYVGRAVDEALAGMAPPVGSFCRAVLDSGEPVLDVEMLGLTPDMSVTDRTWQGSYYPVRHRQSTVGVGIVVTDVTDSRRLETELRQSQKLQAVGQLAGGLAHDYNNVLAGIRLNLELVERQATDPGVLETVRHINQAVEAATRFTQRLLVFARPEPAMRTIVDVAEVSAGVATMLTHLLPTGIALRMAAHSVPPVIADRAEVEQIVLNLALNARDAMPQGGLLSLSTGLRHLDDAAAATLPGLAVGVFAELRVSDSGTGMEPAVAERAGEPFYTTKDLSTGTGLGLSTVNGIVRRCGGQVSVATTPGVGTVVRVLLPAVSAAVRPVEPPTGDTLTGDGQRVVVVDDDDDVRQVVAAVLESAGYEVATTGDAEAAVAAARLQVDLLLTDVVLPGTSGTRLADRVGRVHGGVPVVFMSGYPSDVLLQRGLVSDDAVVLAKPFSRTDLLEVVAKALTVGR